MSSTTSKQKGNLYLASSLCDGLEDYDLKQVKTLLRNKEADPNVLMPLHGITPFHLVIGNDSEAFAEEVTKLFLRHGGNPNVKSVDGMTPVHVAAAWGRARILELLLANGGDPLDLDSDQCSPFHYAFQGEHYEAVQVLSKYCINKGEDDEEPRYKRELDRVLINNGEVLAEYTMLNNSFSGTCSQNQYSKEDTQSTSLSNNEFSNHSRPSLSVDSKFITMRKNQMKNDSMKKPSNYCETHQTGYFDFKRDTVEEEMRLINEIISQLSSSIASDGDNASNHHFTNSMESSFHQTDSPRKIQIKMTFNRQKQQNQSLKRLENVELSNVHSTLQVIKKHNLVPELDSDEMFSIKRNTKYANVSNERAYRTRANLTSKDEVTHGQIVHMNQFSEDDSLLDTQSWQDETIISKSPNLHVKTNFSNSDKQKKNCNLQKKATPTYARLFKKSPSVAKNDCQFKVLNRPNSVCAPLSRIPKPKKFFTTPSKSRTNKRSMNPLSATNIPHKRKISLFGEVLVPGSNNSILQSNGDQPPQTLSHFKENVLKKQESSMTVVDSKEFSTKSYESLDCSRNHVSSSIQNWIGSTRTDSLLSNPASDQCLSRLHAISGVDRLESEMALECNTKPYNVTEVEGGMKSGNICQGIDMNQAILDSCSNNEVEKSSSQFEESLHSKNCNNSMKVNNSNFCEKTGLSSNMRDGPSSTSILGASLATGDNDGNEEVVGRALDSPKSDLISKSSNSSSRTFFSIEEEYKYEDAEEGVALLERRLCISPSCASTDLNSSFHSCSTAASEPLPKELFLLDNATLRDRLKTLGENPGPITSTTHHVYLKRLHKLEKQRKKSPCCENNSKESSSSMNKERGLLTPFLLSIEWVNNLSDLEIIEQKVFQEFITPDPSRKWREGTSKMSFNYLLLDPRVTKNLPRRAMNLSMSEKWETFLSGIFYVGKGKKSRPYEHLYDAFKIWVSQDQLDVTSCKIQRILDIWNEGKGVIVLHVFHNTIPVEAYTREAAMIDVLGTKKLGNCKCGDYYGVVATWRMKEKRDLGRYLLYKAMQILLIEGERQIFPDNL